MPVIHISSGGLVQRDGILLTGPDPRLADEVRIMIELSQFSRRCIGKTVHVSFKFIREGVPVEKPGAQIFFIPPNRFDILSAPSLPSVDFASPAPPE
jgi:hypothetical protein